MKICNLVSRASRLFNKRYIQKARSPGNEVGKFARDKQDMTLEISHCQT